MAKKGKIVTVNENAQSALEIGMNELESLRDEMGEWAGNMEGTGLENTEKYERVREAADTLDNAVSELEGKSDEIEELLQKADADVSLSRIDVTYSEFVPYKGRSLSRSDRLSNARDAAIAAIEAARPVIESWMPAGPFVLEGRDDAGAWSWSNVAETEEEATFEKREEATDALEALVEQGRDRTRLHVIEAQAEEEESEAETLQEALDLLQECEDGWGEVEDVEFPGMFG